MTYAEPIDGLEQLVGRELGPSEWFVVDQARIDAFADVTEDHQFIHVDPERAADGPYGTTIAHGFLTLALLTRLAAEFLIKPEGTTALINYGFDKVRFLAPVPSGARVRARATVLEAGLRKPGQALIKYAFTVEIEGGEMPALSAEWLALAMVS